MMIRHHMLGLGLVLAVLVPNAAAAGEFPDDWYFDRPAEHTNFEGGDMPALSVGDWVGPAFKTEDLQGKIVIIDFWATWCGPCIAAMPHNNELAKEYADQGVQFIGVCLSNDPAQMPKILSDNNVAYPNAYVDGEQVATDWPVQWYPTYAVVDRQGVVRAIGLKPDHVSDVVEALLDEAADGTRPARVRAAWLEGDTEKRARLSKLEEQALTPPALQVEKWMNAEPIDLASLAGKVVVLDFFATWSGPSLRDVPKHQALIEKYGEQGLVFIGVCATHASEALGSVVEDYGISYPVCVDIDNQTNTAYGPDGYSDYYLIDRSGKLRIADCANGHLEEAVAALLAEPAPEADDTDEAGRGEAAVDDGGKPERPKVINEPAVE